MVKAPTPSNLTPSSSSFEKIANATNFKVPVALFILIFEPTESSISCCKNGASSCFPNPVFSINCFDIEINCCSM